MPMLVVEQQQRHFMLVFPLTCVITLNFKVHVAEV